MGLSPDGEKAVGVLTPHTSLFIGVLARDGFAVVVDRTLGEHFLFISDSVLRGRLSFQLVSGKQVLLAGSTKRADTIIHTTCRCMHVAISAYRTGYPVRIALPGRGCVPALAMRLLYKLQYNNQKLFS